MKKEIVYKAQRVILILFIIAALVFGYFIIKLADDSKNNWIKNKSTNSKVINMYNGYKGKPNYQVMLLADSQRFTIPKGLLNKLQIGDSVFKQKDSNFYIFTLQKTKQKIRAGWN